MEKVLIFENNRSKEYWFRRILKALSNQNVFLKAYLYKHEIWFNGNRIMFKTLREITDQNGYDKFTIIYTNMEYRLENYFKETMEEVLLDV